MNTSIETGKPAQQPQSGGVFGWFDKRVGLRRILHEALDEPIPGGARFAYVFGSGLLFIFMSQAITGLLLALYYVPTADHAHTTVAYIVKAVSAGSFLRSVHAYGSSAMVILLLMHVTQTFLYGAYKGRRELLWLSGCCLFALVLCMAFTGYLLPWDEKAYFATAVGTNIASEVPVIGPWIKALMRGGNNMGTLTISRFFLAHAILIPAAIFGFIATHVFLFRKAGAAGPIDEDPFVPKKPSEPFYPKQVIIDGLVALVICGVLALLANIMPFDLGPKANPADTHYVPRPEWYYVPMFQWLKYWPGSLSFIGIVVVPAVLAFLFASLPFMDRRMERRPWKRPVAVGTYVCILFALFGLGYISYRNDHKDPLIAQQVMAQNQAMADYMRQPFQADLTGGAGAVATAAADPLVSKGSQLFEAQGCSACHGSGGVGTAAAPKLVGIHQRFSADQLDALFKSPTPQMNAGGMPAITLSPDDKKALIAYIESL